MREINKIIAILILVGIQIYPSDDLPIPVNFSAFNLGASNNLINTQRDSSVIPPINFTRVAGEVFAGAVGGIVGGILGIFVGNLTENSNRRDGISVGQRGIAGFMIGGPIGSAIGVYLVGNIGNETGSYKQTLVGSIVGGYSGFLLSFAIGSDVGLVSLIAGPPIGAIIGFNLSRKYKLESNIGGLTPAQPDTKTR